LLSYSMTLQHPINCRSEQQRVRHCRRLVGRYSTYFFRRDDYVIVQKCQSENVTSRENFKRLVFAVSNSCSHFESRVDHLLDDTTSERNSTSETPPLRVRDHEILG
jgi:hypothetical protein